MNVDALWALAAWAGSLLLGVVVLYDAWYRRRRGPARYTDD